MAQSIPPPNTIKTYFTPNLISIKVLTVFYLERFPRSQFLEKGFGGFVQGLQSRLIDVVPKKRNNAFNVKN